jgi:hypothetical protein
MYYVLRLSSSSCLQYASQDLNPYVHGVCTDGNMAGIKVPTGWTLFCNYKWSSFFVVIYHQSATHTFNPLKLKLVQIIFNNSVHTSKRTPHFTITKINCLMLLKEIIAIKTEKHINPTNTKCKVAFVYSSWYI